jgi:hypothetical protein
MPVGGWRVPESDQEQKLQEAKTTKNGRSTEKVGGGEAEFVEGERLELLRA